jgi:hypothetical protein
MRRAGERDVHACMQPIYERRITMEMLIAPQASEEALQSVLVNHAPATTGCTNGACCSLGCGVAEFVQIEDNTK